MHHKDNTHQAIRRNRGRENARTTGKKWTSRAFGGALTLSVMGAAGSAAHAGDDIVVYDGEYETTVKGSEKRRRRASTQITGKIRTEQPERYGIEAQAPGKVELYGARIETLGARSHGLVIGGGADITSASFKDPARAESGGMERETTIRTSGANAHGIYLRECAGAGDSTCATPAPQQTTLRTRHTLVGTAGGAADGIHINDRHARIELGQGTMVGGTGENSRGIYVARNKHMVIEHAGIHMAGPSGHGVVAEEGAVVKIVDAKILVKGKHGIGVEAVDAARCAVLCEGASVQVIGGSIRADGEFGSGASVRNAVLDLQNVDVEAMGPSSTGLRNTDGLIYVNGGKVMSSGYPVLQASSLDAHRKTVFNLSNTQAGNGKEVLLELRQANGTAPRTRAVVNLQGTTIARGDIVGTMRGWANLDLSGDARWIGAGNAMEKMRIQDRAGWVMTKNSSVNHLDMDGGATVTFEKRAATQAGPEEFSRLLVRGNLSGKGLFVMNTDLAERRGDFLDIIGEARGSHRVLVRDSGKEPERARPLRIIHADRGDAEFALQNRDQVVNAGVYQYRLQRSPRPVVGGVDWDLVPAGKLQPTEIVLRQTPSLVPVPDKPLVPRPPVEIPIGPAPVMPAPRVPVPPAPVVPVRPVPVMPAPPAPVMPAPPAPVIPVATPKPVAPTVPPATPKPLAPAPVPRVPVETIETPHRVHAPAPVPTAVQPRPPAVVESPVVMHLEPPRPGPAVRAIIAPGTAGNPEVAARGPEVALVDSPQDVDVLPPGHGDDDEGAPRKGAAPRTKQVDSRPRPHDTATVADPGAEGNAVSDAAPVAESEPGTTQGGAPASGVEPGGEPEGGPGEEPGAEPGAEPEGGPEANAEPEAEPDAQPDSDPDPGSSAEASPIAESPPPAPRTLSATAKTVINSTTTSIAQATWNANLATVSSRMHDVRRQPGAGAAAALDPRGAPLYPDEGDVWIKAAEARQHVRNPLTGEYRQSIGGIVVGADRAFGTGAARWRGGVLTGYTNVYRHFDDGNSRSESAQFGAYATWSGADGTYVGGVALVNSYSHRLTAHGSDGSRAKARFDSTGAGLSLEAGRRLDLRDSIFVEPYVGIDYYRAGGAKYMTGNGMSVRDPGGYSFQLRTGARGGVTWETADGSLVRPYVRAGWAQELGNRNRVELNGIDFSYEGSGGRLEAGTGVEAMIAKRHFVYLDYGYATGHDMRQPWSVGAGYRYVW